MEKRTCILPLVTLCKKTLEASKSRPDMGDDKEPNIDSATSEVNAGQNVSLY